MEKFELSDEELEFLDTQLQFVLDSLEETRKVVVKDRSLTMEELLQTDPSIGESIKRCEEILVRVQKEMNVRRIGRG
jgi:D-ribose pyranose/furanose isomerase RbsD